MSIILRTYHPPTDFDRVGEFITGLFQPGNTDGNWLRPAWEYMHCHPMLDESALDRIGIWEEDGQVVGAAHYESSPGEAFFQVRHGYAQLKPDMLTYAEAHLSAVREGRTVLRAFVPDFDTPFTTLVQARGYQPLTGEDRPMAGFDLPQPTPPISLPAGFRLQSLADENDLHKIDRVIWRGFNHPGEPPADNLEGRRKMQSGPHFRRDLNIVAVAPNGQYAAYAGTWFDPANRLAYVEPVATDPDYRRLGLGRAAVLEGLRRCAAEGAASAYVGSDLPFYQALGFRVIYTSRCWEKAWDERGIILIRK